LKNLKTGEPLNDPQILPENWGPIFGLHGFIDRIGDLGSWLGPDYADLGWVIVGEAPEVPESTKAEKIWEEAKRRLLESDWSMLSDIPMTSGKKAEWIEYRRELRNIRNQPRFPDEVNWPGRPGL